MNNEIQDLEQKMGESSNVFSRGLFKGNVSKKIQEVEELFQQGKSHDSLVVDNLEWIGQALSTTTLFGEAAKFCMEEIWGYLMGADVQKIGVWGMGGIGKTTIMKLVHNQLLEETQNFDIVIWITVSKEMNIFKMQNRIARAMKVTLDEDQDETIRAGIIREMLAGKGKYVLILDDLWEKLSLEEVGIPEPSNGSKLLVTTRLLDVCRFLGCREVRVPTLSKPDAWSLFLEKVGLDVSSHPDLLPLVESVAEECAGLPLAIVTIANSMKGIYDVREWRNALHELKRHVTSVNKIEEKVFQLNGCDIICTDNDIKVPSDVEQLNIRKCKVDLCEQGAFLSRFVSVPLNYFSSLEMIEIEGCKNIKKLFSSNWVLHNLQNLQHLWVSGCDELEEIIASESELEEEGISAFKFTLPNLWELKLQNLPELKSICGANGVMVCDSIGYICINDCPKLKRIPLNLPLQDDGQPSPPPSLRGIHVSSKEWWESVEWDHPNAKSLLEPYIQIVQMLDHCSDHCFFDQMSD